MESRPSRGGLTQTPGREAAPFAEAEAAGERRIEAGWGEVALGAFRTPWRHLGTAGCAAGADVKPGSLEGPGLAETPRDRVGSQDELCPRPPRRSLEKRKQLRECCEASDTRAAVLGGRRAVGERGWGLPGTRGCGCRRPFQGSL